MSKPRYTIGNLATLGLFDLIKGALFPDEALSPEHLLNSLGLAGVILGGYYTTKGSMAAGKPVRLPDVDVKVPKGAFEGAGTKAIADVRKFSDYIFKDGAAPGKDVVFKRLGYNTKDSEMLVNIYQKQAAAKYASGNYTLGKLDNFGQRISIEIELNGIGSATGKTSCLQSGWMIKPDGSITLNTPFSGFTQ